MHGCLPQALAQSSSRAHKFKVSGVMVVDTDDVRGTSNSDYVVSPDMLNWFAIPEGQLG